MIIKRTNHNDIAFPTATVDAAHKLTDAMKVNGLCPSDLPIADGSIHRFHVQGDKAGTKNGWYSFFDYPVLAAVYGSWKTGQKYTWCFADKCTLSSQQRLEHQRSINDAIKQQRLKKEAEQVAVAKDCHRFFYSLPSANHEHQYLVIKGVQAFGIRQKAENLVIALRNIQGDIISLQFIAPDGRKRFKRGGRTNGGFHLIGDIGSVLYICEGYATGATIYQQKDQAVAVAFNANNLVAVAQAFRKKFPELDIIIAADNDRFTFGNPGLTHARKAASTVDGQVVYPSFPHGCRGTDFNDLSQLSEA